MFYCYKKLALFTTNVDAETTLQIYEELSYEPLNRPLLPNRCYWCYSLVEGLSSQVCTVPRAMAVSPMCPVIRLLSVYTNTENLFSVGAVMDRFYSFITVNDCFKFSPKLNI